MLRKTLLVRPTRASLQLSQRARPLEAPRRAQSSITATRRPSSARLWDVTCRTRVDQRQSRACQQRLNCSRKPWQQTHSRAARPTHLLTVSHMLQGYYGLTRPTRQLRNRSLQPASRAPQPKTAKARNARRKGQENAAPISDCAPSPADLPDTPHCGSMATDQEAARATQQAHAPSEQGSQPVQVRVESGCALTRRGALY